MTEEEKQTLINRIADLSLRDVLTREDMVDILRICRDACNRRIAEIEAHTKPTGREQ